MQQGIIAHVAKIDKIKFNAALQRMVAPDLIGMGVGLDRMIFDVGWLIAYVSTYTPLAPGEEARVEFRTRLE